MNRRQNNTLNRVFESPIRVDITWGEVENLLNACGALISDGRGSRKRITLHNHILRIHAPHPQREFKRWAVAEIKGFLEHLGITPQQGAIPK